MKGWERTCYCGKLNEEMVGKVVTLTGWVRRLRDHGGLIFVDLADREGIIQVVFNPQVDKSLHRQAHRLREEYVIGVKGEVRKRSPETVNPRLPTGKIEVLVWEMKVFSRSEPLPFEISQDKGVSEEVRLKYRYLDLRREKIMGNLLIRSRVIKAIRDYLFSQGFMEVETPFLTKSTPEGARDYLVPSRLSPGKFYALPQSPQLFKQLLMVAGVDRYFQVVRCFRDEDLRADRQPEFTQLDVEMSFVDEEDIFSVMEGLFLHIFDKILGIKISVPFPRLSYNQALEEFGNDNPDLRYDLRWVDVTEEIKGSQFQILHKVISQGGKVKGVSIPRGGKFSRKEVDELIEVVREWGGKGLTWFKVTSEGLQSSVAKFFSGVEKPMREKTGARPGDLILLLGELPPLLYQLMSNLRSFLGKKLKLIPQDEVKFLWVVDYPLFKYNEIEKRWESEHHPFTSPREEDIPLLDKSPEKVLSRAYDLVLNGVELGSGSIRIHQREVQEKVFKVLGMSREEMREKFGFLLEAFKYGVPPHGGIAPGLDRFLMLITGSDSIREVIAFPKTQKAVCPLTGSPSAVREGQLKELHIKLDL